MERPPYRPQHIEHGLQQLGGEPLDEFAPNHAVLAMTLLGGLVLLAAGVAVLYFAFINFDADVLQVWWAPLLLLGGGGYLTWRGWGLWGQRLLVCPDGLLLVSGGAARACPWSDIQRVEQPEGTLSFDIVRGTGDDWHLDSLTTPRIGRLEKFLREQTGRRGIPWVAKKKDAGE